MSTIPAEAEDCQEFKANLGYKGCSKLVYATEGGHVCLFVLSGLFFIYLFFYRMKVTMVEADKEGYREEVQKGEGSGWGTRE